MLTATLLCSRVWQNIEKKKIILILIYKTSGFESNSNSIATFESGRR